jgi:hypothetical protein
MVVNENEHGRLQRRATERDELELELRTAGGFRRVPPPYVGGYGRTRTPAGGGFRRRRHNVRLKHAMCAYLKLCIFFGENTSDGTGAPPDNAGQIPEENRITPRNAA